MERFHRPPVVQLPDVQHRQVPQDKLVVYWVSIPSTSVRAGCVRLTSNDRALTAQVTELLPIPVCAVLAEPAHVLQ